MKKLLGILLALSCMTIVYAQEKNSYETRFDKVMIKASLYNNHKFDFNKDFASIKSEDIIFENICTITSLDNTQASSTNSEQIRYSGSGDGDDWTSYDLGYVAEITIMPNEKQDIVCANFNLRQTTYPELEEITFVQEQKIITSKQPRFTCFEIRTSSNIKLNQPTVIASRMADKREADKKFDSPMLVLHVMTIRKQ